MVVMFVRDGTLSYVLLKFSTNLATLFMLERSSPMRATCLLPVALMIASLAAW